MSGGLNATLLDGIQIAFWELGSPKVQRPQNWTLFPPCIALPQFPNTTKLRSDSTEDPWALDSPWAMPLHCFSYTLDLYTNCSHLFPGLDLLFPPRRPPQLYSIPAQERPCALGGSHPQLHRQVPVHPLCQGLVTAQPAQCPAHTISQDTHYTGESAVT